MDHSAIEDWDSGHAYEQYVGRWSRKVAPEFLRLLGRPRGLEWADIGSGTGASASAILTTCEPSLVYAIDSSKNFVYQAQLHINDPRVRFESGDAARLPWESDAFDVSVSGLVLNFVPDPDLMVRELARITTPDGSVAGYVWDYAGDRQMMRHFWDAALAVSPNDAGLDQAERSALQRPMPA